MLQAQLIPCKNLLTYESKMRSEYARGYIFGFIDAAIQKLGLPHADHDEALMRIIAGHSFVLHDTGFDVWEFVKESIALQDHAKYRAGHELGVAELFASFKEDTMHLGLMRHLAGEPALPTPKPRFHMVDGEWVEKSKSAGR